MKIAALSPDGAAERLALTPDPGALPCRRGMAFLIRRLVSVRGAVARSMLIDWLVRTAAGGGYSGAAVRPRAESVLAGLVAAGEIVELRCGGESALVGRPVRTVAVSADMAAVVGTDGTEDGATERFDGGDPDSFVRHIPLAPGALSLTDELGEPGFRSTLRMLNLGSRAQASLADFAVLLRDAAIRMGEPCAPDAIRVLGTDAAGTDFGYGYVAGSDAPAVLSLPQNGVPTVLRLPDPEALGWLALALHGGAGACADWSRTGAPLPRQMAAALCLAGRPLDDAMTRWSLPDGAWAAIGEWLGLDTAVAALPEAAPDPGQRRVAGAGPSVRMIVEAGPGSGKTRVACLRVAHLLEEGVSPTRVWLISFTRAAVGEIRDRIAAFLPDPRMAAEVRVVTIDSLSWRLRHAFAETDGAAPTGGYEANVGQTLALLRARDPLLLEFLEGIEHLVVDEAQDLTGSRRELVHALICALDRRCGVTVFQDSAQAIYGYSDRGVPPGACRSLKTLLEDDRALGFGTVHLDVDHRTRTPSLRRLFSEAREVLLRAELAPEARYARVRELIEDAADSVLPPVRNQDVSAASTLILFRTRGEMLSAAADLWQVGADFRVRLTGRQEAVVPWVGALLSRFEGSTVSRRGFDSLWEEVWPPILSVAPERAWERLRAVGGTGRDAVDVGQLRQRLAAGTPPLEFVDPYQGGRGAVLSTIHGAKGREAEHVRLMLPRLGDTGESADWDEEARVLFVGASRARSSLRLGAGSVRLRELAGSGRLWRAWNFSTGRNARAEVGLDGDVDGLAQVTPTASRCADVLAAAQMRLWQLAGRTVPLRALKDGDGEGYALYEDAGNPEGQPVGYLSQAFVRDLWAIGRELHGQGAAPPRSIRGIHLVGVRTAFVAPGGTTRPEGMVPPHAASGVWLVPVVGGLPAVFFNVRNG